MRKLQEEDLLKDNFSCFSCIKNGSEFDSSEHAFLGGDPSTKSGRHIQRGQAKILPQIPVICCGIFTFVMMSLAINSLVASSLMNRLVDKSEKLINVISSIRKERQQVIA